MIRTVMGLRPKIDPGAFVAETTVIIGDAETGPPSSVRHNYVKYSLQYIAD